MRQFVIDETTVSDNPYFPIILRELKGNRSQMSKVYRTCVQENPVNRPAREFTFVTTSKQIHLDLGTLSRIGQLHLAKLLQYEFDRNDFSELLLYPRSKMDRNSGILVTMATAVRTDVEVIVFNLSPAH